VPTDAEAPARDIFTDCLRILESTIPGGRPLPMGSPVLGNGGPGGNSADSPTLLGVPTVGTSEVVKTAKVAESLKCKLCGQTSKTSGNLNRHIRAVHFRSKNFSCDKCGKKFSQKVNLDRHCIQHTAAGSKRYRC
jgi:uncharacterized Zn-finger protein